MRGSCVTNASPSGLRSLGWMSAARPLDAPLVHPVVEFAEGGLGDSDAVIVRPAPDDRVQAGDDGFGVGPAEGKPFRLQPLHLLPHRGLARLDQQLPAARARLRSPVATDV